MVESHDAWRGARIDLAQSARLGPSRGAEIGRAENRVAPRSCGGPTRGASRIDASSITAIRPADAALNRVIRRAAVPRIPATAAAFVAFLTIDFADIPMVFLSASPPAGGHNAEHTVRFPSETCRQLTQPGRLLSFAVSARTTVSTRCRPSCRIVRHVADCRYG